MVYSMKRFVYWFGIAVVTLLANSWALAQSPNVLLIVSDDQGYADLGCFGSQEILTPNLDQLASEGMCLTNFYVSWPACTPSRASLLTGRYPQRHGVYDMIRNEAPDFGRKYTAAEYAVTFERIGGMDEREVILPAMLAPAGYRSAIFGKWDLGSLKRFLPTSKGFHEFYGFVNTGIDYFTHERYGVPSMYRNESPTTADKGTYCTDLFVREALAFLDRTKSKPFFLYLPFNAPHGASNLDPKIRGAAQATTEFKNLYPELQEKAGFQQGTRYGKPAIVLNKAARRLEYAASVSQMDAAIGQVIDKLKEDGRYDDTIVIFFSDNGGGGAAKNQPLRGSKGDMFEGGIRVPAIIRYPGKIPSGGRSDAFCSSIDLLPTILRACGAELPDVKLDGADMLPALAGDTSIRNEMFWQRKDSKAARVGNWKWVDSKKGSGLFNLATDVGEQQDLSGRHPEKLAQLRAAFDQWRREMDAASPRGPFKDF